MTLIHKVGPDCGIGRVTIDGQPAPVLEIDTYSSTVEWNRRTVLATNLSPTRHEVVVNASGSKNVKSSNTYVQIVEFINSP